MDDLASRKNELYRAYDEAALRILMDRYGEDQGGRLLAELRAIPEEETAVPGGEERAVTDTLARCAKQKRASLRRSAALRACCKAAAVLLVLGSLAGYASFTASANHERQANAGKSGCSAPLKQDEAAGEQPPEEEKGEDSRNEVRETAH